MSSQGIKLTEREMRYISLFEAYTGATVRDCVEDDSQVVFIINKGDKARAIGRKGATIQGLIELFKKRVKVIEHSDDVAEFIANALQPAHIVDIKINERTDGKIVAVAHIHPSDKGMTIGKGGKNIELIRQIVKRHHNIDHVIIQ